MPIIYESYTKPVDLEKVVQYSDPRVKENLEPFIPESCLKEVQPRIIVPEPRLLEEVPRSTLGPRAPPFPLPNSDCGATSKVINTGSTSVLESVVANMSLIATEVIKFSGDPCEFSEKWGKCPVSCLLFIRRDVEMKCNGYASEGCCRALKTWWSS